MGGQPRGVPIPARPGRSVVGEPVVLVGPSLPPLVLAASVALGLTAGSPPGLVALPALPRALSCTEGGDGVSGRQPPAQPRLSAAVGCWLFAGCCCWGRSPLWFCCQALTVFILCLRCFQKSCRATRSWVRQEQLPTPRCSPPRHPTQPHPTPRHAALQCGAAVTDLGLPDPWPDIVLDEQQHVHHHQHDQVIQGGDFGVFHGTSSGGGTPSHLHRLEMRIRSDLLGPH